MAKGTEKRFETEIEVIFRDIDALGHVNNAVFFTYMETARIRFMMQELNLTQLTELPLILAKATCDFLAPARFGDKLRVSVFVSKIGNKSFTLEYDIVGEGDKSIATGSSVIVTFDYRNNSPIPIPIPIKTLLERHYCSENNDQINR